MSLIDEALKRARLDAARQDAARQTLAEAPRSGGFASPWAHTPPGERRRRRGSHSRQVALAVVAAVSLAIGAAGITLYLRSPRGVAAQVPAPSASRVAGVTLAALAGAHPDGAGTASQPDNPQAAGRPGASARVSPDTGPDGARGPRLGKDAGDDDSAAGRPATATESRQELAATRRALPEAALPEVAPLRQSEPSSPLAEHPAGAAGASGAPSAQPGAPAAAPPPQAASSPRLASSSGQETSAGAARLAADGGTYVGEVKVADGSVVKLSGIAYSELSPVAVINGKVLGPGQGIDQVTVDKIEADRVTLRDRSGMLFYLRLN